MRGLKTNKNHELGWPHASPCFYGFEHWVCSGFEPLICLSSVCDKREKVRIFSQRIIGSKLLLVGNKSDINGEFILELITVYNTRFVVKCF